MQGRVQAPNLIAGHSRLPCNPANRGAQRSQFVVVYAGDWFGSRIFELASLA